MNKRIVFLMILIFLALFSVTAQDNDVTDDDLMERIEELERRIAEVELEVEENRRDMAINQEDLDIYPKIDWGKGPHFDISGGMFGTWTGVNLGFQLGKWRNVVSLGIVFSYIFTMDEVWDNEYGSDEFTTIAPLIGPSLKISSPMLFNLTRFYGGIEGQIGYLFYQDASDNRNNPNNMGPERVVRLIRLNAGMEFFASSKFAFFVEASYSSLAADLFDTGGSSIYITETNNGGLGLRLGFQYYLNGEK